MFLFQGIFCDLITGEERRWAVSENEPSNHLACTVEVCSTTRECREKLSVKFCLYRGCYQSLFSSDDCAVIDEIQMIAEPERGFAWTKALLGKKKLG